MRVLVTGGAGFIGSHFVDLIVCEPTVDAVIVVDALTYAGNLENLAKSRSEIVFHEKDIRDYELMDSLAKNVDAVVNFAAETHNDNSLENHSPFLDTNVIGTANLIDICTKRDIRFHQVSTDEVFGDFELDSNEEWDERSPYNPSSPYSASKASADHLVRAWQRSHGLASTISLCSNNFGPRQHREKLIPSAIRSISNGGKAKIYGDGKNIREWIYVGDHVRGIWKALTLGQIGSTYLFGTRDRVENKELVSSIATNLGRGEESIEYVIDRKGHDRRYALNPDLTSANLNWIPEHGKIMDSIPDLISEYASV